MKNTIVATVLLAGVAILAIQDVSLVSIAIAIGASLAALRVRGLVEPTLRGPAIRISVWGGARLVWTTLASVVASGVRMCVLMIGPSRFMDSRMVEVPLELQSPIAIALLANIITLTPGTVSVERIDNGRHSLRVHCLGMPDEVKFVADLKRGLEADVKRFLEGGK